MEYKLVVAQYGGDLTEKVNGWLRQGWALYGSPFADDIQLYQAVTKGTPRLVPTPYVNTMPGLIGVDTLSTQMYSGLEGNKPS